MSIAAELLAGVVKGGLPDLLPAHPMPIVREWFDDARANGNYDDPNAMTLATCTPDGFPAARIVLCKGLDDSRIVFYTNYTGRKARELQANPRAACVFFWPHANRQARIEGVIERASAQESDAYFATRPLLSKLGAWASRQSEPMASRADLVDAVGEVVARFKKDLALHPTGATIPRPEFWGGFQILPTAVELWCGAKGGRLHDRARWTRTRSASGDWSPWTSTRLFP